MTLPIEVYKGTYSALTGEENIKEQLTLNNKVPARKDLERKKNFMKTAYLFVLLGAMYLL
jgi:hypothetical protein